LQPSLHVETFLEAVKNSLATGHADPVAAFLERPGLLAYRDFGPVESKMAGHLREALSSAA